MNCKPGDLARVVWTPEFPENEGGLVQVIGPASPSFYYGKMDCFHWEVRTLSRLWGWDNDEQSIKAPSRLGDLMAFRDQDLRPIRGGETPEESAEAMKRLHDTSAPARKKEPVVRPFEWEKL